MKRRQQSRTLLENTEEIDEHLEVEPGELREVAPVSVNGAFVDGHLYYPYRVKRVTKQDGETLSRYETRVLRSDGVSLGYGYKPAPKGTPTEDRVLALDDGTDISRAPSVRTDQQSFSLAGLLQQQKRVVPGEKVAHK